MSKFDIRKWRQLNESSGQNKRMTEDEKKQTLDAVSKFNEYSKSIYKTNEISEMVENIRTLADNASKMAIEETADWFDAVSVKRDTKAIGESVKVFESTFREISTLQQRLESVYEDIGSKLGKYYEINEIDESKAQDEYRAKFQKALDVGRNLSEENIISVIWHDNVLKMKGGRVYKEILEFLTSQEDVKIFSGNELVKILD